MPLILDGGWVPVVVARGDSYAFCEPLALEFVKTSILGRLRYRRPRGLGAYAYVDVKVRDKRIKNPPF